VKHECSWCNDDEECPGSHTFFDIENATDEQLREEGLQRIPVLSPDPEIYCKQRVWSNGDTKNCNKKAYTKYTENFPIRPFFSFIGGFCKEHFDRHKKDLKVHKQELIDELSDTNERLKRMENNEKPICNT